MKNGSMGALLLFPDLRRATLSEMNADDLPMYETKFPNAAKAVA